MKYSRGSYGQGLTYRTNGPGPSKAERIAELSRRLSKKRNSLRINESRGDHISAMKSRRCIEKILHEIAGLEK